MEQLVQRITAIPLRHADYLAKQALPFDLGYGVSVRDLSPLISQLDLSFSSRYVAPGHQQEIKQWSICLEHRYEAPPIRGKAEKDSARLLHYLIAHLRFLAPTMTAAGYALQGTIHDGKLEPIGFSPYPYPIFLEDCEVLCTEISPRHLEELKPWMPWVVEFKDRWRDFWPLYFSLDFSEKAYLEEDAHIRHLFRVMALEALVSSEEVYGKKALVPRLAKLIGEKTNVYEQYRSELQPDLPKMVVDNVIGDVCIARNKIAHGDMLPAAWLAQNRRQGIDHTLNYSDELRELTAGMVSLAWKEILNKGLQQTFADKRKMEQYLR